jgi:DNA-binding response OmpR family regulator
MDTPRILVVDDEEEICSVTKSLLTKRKFAVSTATNGAQALESIRKEKPDLVLLDFRLGDESGIDILNKLKALDKNIKVVMVTGLGDEESIRQAIVAGVDDYIIKPFTSDYLNDVINRKLKTGGA